MPPDLSKDNSDISWTQVIRYITNSRTGSLEGLFVSRWYNTLGPLSNGSSHRSKAKPRFRLHDLALLLNLGGTGIAFKVKDLDFIPLPSPNGWCCIILKPSSCSYGFLIPANSLGYEWLVARYGWLHGDACHGFMEMFAESLYPTAIWFQCWTFCFIKPYFCYHKK